MKVSIDGIVGSARKLNNNRQVGDDGQKNRKEVKSDSVSISSKVNSRIDSIGAELKDIQSSLTKSQITNDGIKQLREDLSTGGKNQQNILSEVKFENKNMLTELFKEPVTDINLNKNEEEVSGNIIQYVEKLRKLQVEVDNIMASNLAGDGKVEGIMENINSSFGKEGALKIDSISNLKADSVMRLVK